MVDSNTLNSINETLHDVRIRWAYPDGGEGDLIEREGTFKKLAVSKSGSLYMGFVETSRDGASVEAYKHFTLCKCEDLAVIQTRLSRVFVFIRGAWQTLLSLLGL